MSSQFSALYSAWLAQTRLTVSKEQHVISIKFSADNTTVCFDNISYATAKVLPEQHPLQE